MTFLKINIFFQDSMHFYFYLRLSRLLKIKALTSLSCCTVSKLRLISRSRKARDHFSIFRSNFFQDQDQGFSRALITFGQVLFYHSVDPFKSSRSHFLIKEQDLKRSTPTSYYFLKYSVTFLIKKYNHTHSYFY